MKVRKQEFRLSKLALIASLAIGIAGCGSDKKEEVIAAVNVAPQITSTVSAAADEGQAYSYTLTASDADNDTLTFSATTLPSWLTFDAATGVLSGTPATADVGDAAVVLSVSDGDDTVTQNFTIVVSAANTAPNITSMATTAATEGQAYSYTLVASDADNDTLTLSATTLPAWLTFDAATGVLSGTPATADVGDAAVVLSVTDGDDTVTQSFTIAVTAVVVMNTAPSVTSTPVTMANVGSSYSYTFSASDADGDTLSYSSVTLPAWSAFDTTTGILSGTPDQVGDHPVELAVTDGMDSVAHSFSIAVTETSAAVLTVFENTALPEWAPWDCCGNTVAGIVTDDVEHDQVTEFTISGDTVVGFSSREAHGAVGGLPFDASAHAAEGTISFEL